MLRILRIKNFAIIDELELDLHSGLNAITGETGAGKSIILDAIGLILGNRANAELIRAGFDEATVEALFEVGQNDNLERKLQANGLEVGPRASASSSSDGRFIATAKTRSSSTAISSRCRSWPTSARTSSTFARSTSTRAWRSLRSSLTCSIAMAA